MQLGGGNVCSNHEDVGLLDACCLFGSLTQHAPSVCDVTSADVDVLAAVPDPLCALDDDKNAALPNYFGPVESPSELSGNKAAAFCF